MSLKLKALLQLIGFVGVALLINFVIHCINIYVSTETLTTVCEYSLIGLLLYCSYSLLLTRLNFKEKHKELDK
jgi:hypothetical protein